jgi:hypothetical protein
MTSITKFVSAFTVKELERRLEKKDEEDNFDKLKGSIKFNMYTALFFPFLKLNL